MSQAEPASRRRQLAPLLLLLPPLLAVLLSAWPRRPPEPASRPAEEPAPARAEPPSPARLDPARGASPSAAPAASASAPQAPKTTAELRLERAEFTLRSYLEGTRYPPDSRPMSEHPDMERPRWVPEVTYPLARPGGRRGEMRVTTRQDRRFLVGDERARLGLRCLDLDGPADCNIRHGALRKLESPRFEGRADGSPVEFRRGQDGWYEAEVQPIAQGFDGYFGPLRVDVALRVGSEEGATGFQLEYTPEPPAAFTDQRREHLADGSAALDLTVRVARAGHYKIVGRIDDAQGQHFALLSFEGDLAQGDQPVRLRLFGKLLLDQAPPQPCALRDLEGYRLIEGSTPDRELMRAREGLVHTFRVYEPRELSSAEWSSEQKDRYVAEYKRDVERARAEVEAQKPPPAPPQ